MLKKLGKWLWGGENQPGQPENHHLLPPSLSSIFHRKKLAETVKVEFLAPAYCYDTSRDTIKPLKINYTPGHAYEMVKTMLDHPKCSEINDSCFWYLFKGTAVGITEMSLNKLIKENKARLVN